MRNLILAFALVTLFLLSACDGGGSNKAQAGVEDELPGCPITNLKERIAKLRTENPFRPYERVEPERILQDRYQLTIDATREDVTMDESWTEKIQLMAEMRQFPELQGRIPTFIDVGSQFGDQTFFRKVEVPQTATLAQIFCHFAKQPSQDQMKEMAINFNERLREMAFVKSIEVHFFFMDYTPVEAEVTLGRIDHCLQRALAAQLNLTEVKVTRSQDDTRVFINYYRDQRRLELTSNSNVLIFDIFVRTLKEEKDWESYSLFRFDSLLNYPEKIRFYHEPSKAAAPPAASAVPAPAATSAEVARINFMVNREMEMLRKFGNDNRAKELERLLEELRKATQEIKRIELTSEIIKEISAPLHEKLPNPR